LSAAVHDPSELLLGATLDELGKTDELDGKTELLLGTVPDELGKIDELDGKTELLLGTVPDELGISEEELLDGQDATTSPPKAEHASAGISAQPTALLQNTEPLCKEKLLLEILLLLKTSTTEEETPIIEEEETSASKEELLIGQDATTVPPKAEHASAGISAQPVAYLQDTKPPGKEELLEEKPLDPMEEELAFPKISSADSMSDVQDKCKPVARTSIAKNKTLFINAPLLN
jgi:hypothetical protein